jgi:hypothetical protein
MAEEGLQFDRTERAEPTAVALCGYCNQPLDGTYYQINGRAACERCHAQLMASLQKHSPAVSFTVATVFGTIASALGAGLWWAVRSAGGGQWGIIALAVGFAVGYAVHYGSNRRGGPLYQALAVVITYLGISAQYVPDVVSAMSGRPDMPSGIVGAITIGVIALAYPFLAGVSNIIGILIVGFALYEAWKLNRRVPLAVSGPFRVEAAAPPL